MKAGTWFKLGQILGFAMMAAGVAMFVMNNKQGFSELMLVGMLVYAGFRMAAWLGEK